MGQGPQASSLANSQGNAARAGEENFSVTSAKMITNSAGPLLPGSGSSASSSPLIGPDLMSLDLRAITLKDGGMVARVRNGTEAFAVVGSSRAYMNDDDVVVMSSGIGTAGVTGTEVWVEDSRYGSASAELCYCTIERRGMMCHCACHCGKSRKH